MFKLLKKLFGKQPTSVQAMPNQQQDPFSQGCNAFDLPPDWDPIDSVIRGTRLPGTNIVIGSVARAAETNRQERIDFEQLIGSRLGCNHSIYSNQELGGVCPICESELYELLKEGQITERLFYERSRYCVRCASFCMICFKRICIDHTRLHNLPDGRVIPLCTICKEAAEPSFFGWIKSLITGK